MYFSFPYHALTLYFTHTYIVWVRIRLVIIIQENAINGSILNLPNFARGENNSWKELESNPGQIVGVSCEVSYQIDPTPTDPIKIG